MAERWAIIEVTIRFDDEIDKIDQIMERIHDRVGDTVCPHPETWTTSSEDILSEESGDACRDFVLGSRVQISPPVPDDENECPFCGHKDD